jgi:sporulation protein YlmC with PRC-barrel domain
MHQRKMVRLMSAAVVLASLPLAASAQSTNQPSPDATPPATRSEPSPLPPAATTQRPMDKPVATVNAKALMGLAVFSSDGSKMGTVQSVSQAPDGSVKAIRIKTGGFLGFGTKLVAIPEGRFTKSGDSIQLGITADEVGKLPEVKEQS